MILIRSSLKAKVISFTSALGEQVHVHRVGVALNEKVSGTRFSHDGIHNDPMYGRSDVPVTLRYEGAGRGTYASRWTRPAVYRLV